LADGQERGARRHSRHPSRAISSAISKEPTVPLTRRDFVQRSAITGAGVALAGAVDVLATAPGALASSPAAQGEADAQSGGHQPELGYGPLIDDPEGLLALPAGFSYRVVTRSGVTTLDSGESTPSNHDGTATFAGERGAVLLVNNHELKGPRANWPHPVPLTADLVYDPAIGGIHRLQFHLLAGVLDLLNPFFSGVGQPVSPLFLIISDVDVHAVVLMAVVLEGGADEVLQGAHSVTMLADKETVQLAGGDAELDDFVLAGSVDIHVDAEE